jgi:phosphatidate cytidylyltransferase
MDFPPRGGSRPGRDDDLDIDFEPLRPTREPTPPRARRPPRQSRLGGRRRRRRRQPGPEPPRKRRGPGSETVARVVWAVPWILFVVAIVAAGGLVFAIAIAGLACVGLAEFFRMTSDIHPFRLVAFAVAIGLIVAAYYGGQFQMVYVGAAAFPLMFIAAAARRERDGVSGSLAFTVFGVAWIAIPFAHAVLLRELPLHGGALLIDVLVGTILTDTFAYFGGRLFGRHPLAPQLSPNKTIEGLIIGIAGGTMGFWFAGLYQDWLSGGDALVIGFCIALVAPMGDLFESMVKRDLGVKDTGRIFGPHGGLLDRIDALIFTIVVGYYLSQALVY